MIYLQLRDRVDTHDANYILTDIILHKDGLADAGFYTSPGILANRLNDIVVYMANKKVSVINQKVFAASLSLNLELSDQSDGDADLEVFHLPDA